MGSLRFTVCPGTTTTFDAKTKLTTFLFGAHFNYRHEKFTPYISTLFGRTLVTGRVPDFRESDSKFGYAGGVGADYKLSKSLAWQFEADYLHTKVFGRSEGNLRFQTGIVWRPSFEKK